MFFREPHGNHTSYCKFLTNLNCNSLTVGMVIFVLIACHARAKFLKLDPVLLTF